MIRRGLFAPLLLLAAALPAVSPGGAAATAATRPERLDRLGVTLEVPQEWQRIDPLDLDAFAAALVEATGGILAESYQYGFATRTTEGFGYPCVLVQVKDTGRVGYRQFLRLPPVERLRRESGEPGPVAELGLGAPPYLREAAFDESHFCLRVTTTVPVLSGEPVVALSGAFLTERGFLVFHGFDRLSGFADSRPLFENVLASVELPPGLRYRPRLADRWPGLRPAAGWRGVLVVVLAAGGGLATYLLVRRRTRARRRRP